MPDGSEEAELELRPDAVHTYPFELFFGESDRPNLSGEFSIDGEVFDISFGEVYRYKGDPEPPAAQVIELEKERQWLLDFASEPVVLRDVPQTVAAFGKAVPDHRYYMELISPVDGHIDPADFSVIPVTGKTVNRGDRIISISPPLTAENSWVEKRLAFIQAEDAYERGKRLIEQNAISFREFQMREREYEMRRAGYEHFIGHGDQESVHILDGGDHLHLKANQSGTVADVHLVPGRQINSGDPILSIFNPDYLWLELTGYRDKIDNLREVLGMEIRIKGRPTISIDESYLELISRDQRSDVTGNRSRITFALDNRERFLKSGEPIWVNLLAGTSEEATAVPESAIFDEDSHRVVFIQHSGDQFERRVVKAGNRYGGFVEITSGLQEGERVVTNGVYPLHLVSGNIEIGHGHTH